MKVLLKSDISDLNLIRTKFCRWELLLNISRVENTDDYLAKYNGFVQSQAMLIKALAKGLYSRVTKSQLLKIANKKGHLK